MPTNRCPVRAHVRPYPRHGCLPLVAPSLQLAMLTGGTDNWSGDHCKTRSKESRTGQGTAQTCRRIPHLLATRLCCRAPGRRPPPAPPPAPSGTPHSPGTGSPPSCSTTAAPAQDRLGLRRPFPRRPQHTRSASATGPSAAGPCQVAERTGRGGLGAFAPPQSGRMDQLGGFHIELERHRLSVLRLTFVDTPELGSLSRLTRGHP